MQRVTFKEAKKAFEVLHQYVEDRNIGSGAFEHFLMNSPIGFVLCDENKDEIAINTIELMAMKSLANHFEAPIYMGVEPYLQRFGKWALKHLSEK